MELQTRKELCIKYKCDPKTLRKFMIAAGIPDRVRLTEGHFAALERVMTMQPTPRTGSGVVSSISPMAFL